MEDLPARTSASQANEPEAPPLSVPPKGWPNAGYIYDELCGWSLAWRVHDAQFWGVPQRRRRIALVMDFAGLTAGEILFESEGVSGNSDQSGAPREGTAPRIKNGIGESSRACTLKIRGGVDVDSAGKSAGKGALITDELSATLGVSQDQTLFCLEGNGSRPSHLGDGYKASETSYTLNTTEQHAVAYNIGSYHSNAWQSDNPHSGVYETEVSKTLDALQCGSPTCNQGGTAVVESALYEPKSLKEENWSESTVKNALRAGESHSSHAVVEPRILDMTHADEVVRDCGDVVPTLQHRMGTGGNQIPLVQTEASMWDGSQTCPTLTANNAGGNQRMPDKDNFNAVLEPTYCMDAGMLPAYEECQPAQLARQYKDPPLINGTVGTLCASGYPDKLTDQDVRQGLYPLQKSVVRRLTPLECTRLQGFPDGWLDIGEWTDSKGKVHKDSDTPKYKALGNSIALPFWQWLAVRISAKFDNNCTMGSLFDGIGGFPLVFETVNGIDTARWASEIEEFPIAVTKYHFGED